MKSLLTIGLLAATAVTSSASAGPVPGDHLILSRIGVSPGHAIRYNYDSTLNWDSMPVASSKYGVAGVNKFSGVNGSIWKSFCVEMNEGFPDDPIDYTVVNIDMVPEDIAPGPMSLAKQNLMKDLYARHYNSVMAYDGSDWAGYGDRAAAFQIVIWEISHENLTSSTDGMAVLSELRLDEGAMAFSDMYSVGVEAMARDMIASLGSNGYLYGFSGLLGLTNPTNQDMLIVVPTPAIAGLAGLGLVGMRRRRR